MDKEESDQNKIWEYFQNEFPELFEGAKSRLNYIFKKIRKKLPRLNH